MSDHKPAPAIFLLIETSELECGVALYQADQSQAGVILAEQRRYQPRQHADLLLGLVDDLLLQAHLQPKDLTAIAIVNGPGAFTGIRIGVAMAQGLAYGWAIPCIPINTLDLWAISALSQHSSWNETICIMDARMGEVYMARYQRSQEIGIPQRIELPACRAPATICMTPQVLQEQPIGLVGSGVKVYQTVFEAMAISNNVQIQMSEMSLCYTSFGVLAQHLYSNDQYVNALTLDAVYLRVAVS